MGMTQEEFWTGNPHLAESYRKAYDIMQEKRNHEMWWQGFYIYEAVSTVHYNLNRKKSEQPAKYPTEPHRIKPISKEEQAETERDKAIRSLDAWKAAWDRQNGK